MTNPSVLCLWCDEPCRGKLCDVCHAANEAPLFHCPIPGHLPTIGGKSCAECDSLAELAAKRAEVNAPLLAQLWAIRASLIAEWRKPWPGCEHGKTLVGQMIDAEIASLVGGPFVRYTVTDPKNDSVVAGLQDVPGDHSLLLRMVPIKALPQLSLHERTYARSGADVFLITRVQ